MTAQQFTIVLPVKLGDSDLDLERIFQINLRSIEVFLDRRILREILVVASEPDLGRLADAERDAGLSLPIRYLNEAELCPSFARHGGSGWFRQQVIKIAAAKEVTSKYMLLSDDDVLMTRPTGLDDLVKGDRLIMSHIPMGAHPEFFESSCRVLKFPFSNLDPTEIVMNVTPEVLVRDILIDMQQEICSLWSCSDFGEWLMQASATYSPLKTTRGLLDRIGRRLFRSRISRRENTWRDIRGACGNWTEYSLYWTHLRKHGLTDLYYDYASDLTMHQIGDAGLWTNQQAAGFDVDDWLSNTMGKDGGHCFAVFSAKITNVNRDEFNEKIIAYLSAFKPRAP